MTEIYKAISKETALENFFWKYSHISCWFWVPLNRGRYFSESLCDSGSIQKFNGMGAGLQFSIKLSQVWSPYFTREADKKLQKSCQITMSAILGEKWGMLKSVPKEWKMYQSTSCLEELCKIMYSTRQNYFEKNQTIIYM